MCVCGYHSREAKPRKPSPVPGLHPRGGQAAQGRRACALQTKMPDGGNWGRELFTAWLPRARRFLGLGRMAGELHVFCCGFYLCVCVEGEACFCIFQDIFPF